MDEENSESTGKETYAGKEVPLIRCLHEATIALCKQLVHYTRICIHALGLAIPSGHKHQCCRCKLIDNNND